MKVSGRHELATPPLPRCRKLSLDWTGISTLLSGSYEFTRFHTACHCLCAVFTGAEMPIPWSAGCVQIRQCAITSEACWRTKHRTMQPSLCCNVLPVRAVHLHTHTHVVFASLIFFCRIWRVNEAWLGVVSCTTRASPVRVVTDPNATCQMWSRHIRPLLCSGAFVLHQWLVHMSDVVMTQSPQKACSCT